MIGSSLKRAPYFYYINMTDDDFIEKEVVDILDTIKDNFVIEWREGKSHWIRKQDGKPYSYEHTLHVLRVAQVLKTLKNNQKC